jgi:RHS repeat-associated protein
MSSTQNRDALSPVNDADKRRHLMVRDGLGRITSKRDVNYNNVMVSQMAFNNYDGDGDVGNVADTSNVATILSTSATTPSTATRTYGYGASNDRLLVSPNTSGNNVTIVTDGQQRRTTVTSATTYTYAYNPSETLTGATSNGAGTPLTVTYPGASVGEPTGITGMFLSGMTYGARGDLTGYTFSTPAATTWNITTDNNRRRWTRRVGTVAAPTQRESYRYAPDGTLADLRRSDSSGTWMRDEFIYLQGMPIAVSHTENLATSPQTFFLSPDTMGTPRRAFIRSSMAQHRRLVLDAWGDGTLYDGATNTSASAGPSATAANIWLPHRLPGQLRGVAEPIVENRYRYYVPTLGQYLTPDPMHMASAMSYGPQAYAYAEGRPLVLTDPDGRRPGQEFREEVDATMDALVHAVEGTLFGATFRHRNGFVYGIEYYGWVCKKRCKNEPCFVATTPRQGLVPSDDAQRRNTTGWSPLGTIEDAERACGSKAKPVRTYHSHPTAEGGLADYGEPSLGDLENTRKRGLGGATMGEQLNGWFFDKSGAPEPGRWPLPINRAFQ